jgi:hypothetical protein
MTGLLGTIYGITQASYDLARLPQPNEFPSQHRLSPRSCIVLPKLPLA